MTDKADRRSIVKSYASRMVPGGALLAVLALLAVVLPGPESTSSTVGRVSGGSAQIGAEGDGRFPDAKELARVADSGGSGMASLRGRGPGGSPSGGSGGTSGGKTYQGVSDDTVLVGGASQQNDCGGANPNSLAGAYGVEPNREPERTLYEVPAKYFSTFGVQEYLGGSFPLPPDVEANVGRGKGLWGRTLKHKFYDDGGFRCPERARAVATKLATQDKVFAMIKVGTAGVERIEATEFARYKLPFVGIYGASPPIYDELAPYTYNGHHVADWEQAVALGSLACRDYAGKKAVDTGDAEVAGQPRKFGVIHTDLQEVNLVKDILLAEVAKCGIKPEVAAYPLDASQVSAVSGPTMARFRSAGVTTILNLIDFFFITVWTTAATDQGYFPEWLNSGYLLQDWAIFVQSWDKQQARNIIAATSGRLDTSIHAPRRGLSPGARAAKRVDPNTPDDNGRDIIFDNWFLFALGVAGAGRDLTAQTWKEGLMRLCNPCPRSDPLLPLRWISSENDYQMFSDFTIVKWNPNKIDHWGPIDTNTKQEKVGYWDHPEGGKRYVGTVYNPE